MSATVVVTVLNERHTVGALIDALSRQTLQPFEIIVVDGGSSDGTFEYLDRIARTMPGLRVVLLPGCSIAAGRNRAIAAARSEVIACTDAGSTPADDWLEHIVAPFRDPEITVVGGTYAIAPHTGLERVIGLLTMPGQLADFDAPRFNPSARSIAFRRSAWRRAGGFPEWLHAAEDTLFVCKLRRMACGYALAEQAVVRWRPRSTLGGVYRQFHDYARGEARIGRGDGGRFWIRRYVCTVLLLVAGLAATVVGHATLGWAAVSAAMLLVIHTAHRRAMRVAHRTRRVMDYVRAVGLEHWVAIASIAGHRAGRRDRRTHPDRYVVPLGDYWGAPRVASVPPWRVKNIRAPRTLIISWHWPPACRASTAVIANLFRLADGRFFSALTRDLPVPPGADRVDPPPIPTHRVPWWLPDDCERTGLTWIASVVACARMVRRACWANRDGAYRVILGIYPHRYGVLAAWIAARVTGVELVLWMHDLLAETLVTDSRIKRAFWRWVDRAALHRARWVMVPTPEFAEHYRARGVHATWVLPHCRDPRAVASPLVPDGDTLRLLYSGSAYQAHADGLRLLVEAADLRCDVRLTLHTNRIEGVDPKRTVWLPRAQAMAGLHDAHVLVVALGRDAPYPEEVHGCFPSKLVDYFAAGRPVLAIVPPGSFVERLVRETGCGIAVTRYSVAAVHHALDRLQDHAVRERMARRALQLANQLQPERWMRALCKRLARGGAGDPQTPRFPATRDDHARRATDRAGRRQVAV